jgi:hypothetical protein
MRPASPLRTVPVDAGSPDPGGVGRAAGVDGDGRELAATWDDLRPSHGGGNRVGVQAMTKGWFVRYDATTERYVLDLPDETRDSSMGWDGRTDVLGAAHLARPGTFWGRRAT